MLPQCCHNSVSSLQLYQFTADDNLAWDFFQCCSCKSRLWEWNLVLSLSCTTAVSRASVADAAWRVVSDGHGRTYSRWLFQDYSKQMECAALIINRAENTLTADTSNEAPIWLSHCHPFTYSANDAVTCMSWIDSGVFLLVLFVCFKIHSFKTFKWLRWTLVSSGLRAWREREVMKAWDAFGLRRVRTQS